MEIIATGDPVDARTAYQYGMINRLVPTGSVMSEALSLARQICANAPIAVRESLSIARRSFDDHSDDLLSDGLAAFARVAKTEDFREGPRAFLEKREPQWKGR